MSKLYNIYLQEKAKNKDLILLFKSGIFYIAVDEDATMLSNLFHLKLTDLNSSVKKCGFPCSSSEKYFHLLKLLNINTKIIDSITNIESSITDIDKINQIKVILDRIKNIDIDSLSVSDSYKFIEDLKNFTENINL